jgi:hypothetical protein
VPGLNLPFGHPLNAKLDGAARLKLARLEREHVAHRNRQLSMYELVRVRVSFSPCSQESGSWRRVGPGQLRTTSALERVGCWVESARVDWVMMNSSEYEARPARCLRYRMGAQSSRSLSLPRNAASRASVVKTQSFPTRKQSPPAARPAPGRVQGPHSGHGRRGRLLRPRLREHPQLHGLGRDASLRGEVRA